MQQPVNPTKISHQPIPQQQQTSFHPDAKALTNNLSNIFESLNRLNESENANKEENVIENCKENIVDSLIKFENEIDQTLLKYSKNFLNFQINTIKEQINNDKNSSLYKDKNKDTKTFLKELASNIEKIKLE